MSNRTDPFAEIERFFTEMSSQLGATTGHVAIDVIDQGDAFELQADLPGYDADDIDLQITDGRRVNIEATRDTESTSETDTYVTRERRQERVSRSVTLPEPVLEEETEASYQGGVLAVTLPKQTVDDSGTDIPVS